MIPLLGIPPQGPDALILLLAFALFFFLKKYFDDSNG